MGQIKKIIGRFLFLFIICSMVMTVSLMTPIPKEPENLPAETWSYYQEKSPEELFVIYHRNEIIAVLILIVLVPDIVLLLLEYRKQRKI